MARALLCFAAGNTKSSYHQLASFVPQFASSETRGEQPQEIAPAHRPKVPDVLRVRESLHCHYSSVHHAGPHREPDEAQVCLGVAASKQ